MKNVNQKIENYNPLDAYLIYDKKKMDEAGIKQAGRDEKAKDVAKKMLEENIAIDVIARCTGLTLDEIEDLKKEKE